MKNYTILFLLMLLSSCQHRKQTLGKEDEKKSELQQFFQVINLKDNLKKCEDELLMSTFVDSVWYVKLETNEESLLGDLGDVKLTSNYLFIDSYHAKCPMMYDKGGKYIHSLGQIGQGPGEFLSTLGIAASDSIICIKPTYSDDLLLYQTHTNRFIRKVSLPKEYNTYISSTSGLTLLGQNMIIYPGCRSDGAQLPVLASALCIVAPDGSIVASQQAYLEPGFWSRRPNEVFMDPPRFWWHQGCVNAHSVVNDTIYGATQDSIFARYFIDLGKYKLPATGYDIQNGERANYIVIRDFVETKDHLLFRYVYQIKCWFSMYDKQTGNIKTWNCAPLKAIRDVPFGTVPIVNDIDGASDLKGDFRYADSKHLYSVITADQSSEVIKIIEKERVVRFPNKKAELKKKLSEMGGDDNPIIVFYRLKD